MPFNTDAQRAIQIRDRLAKDRRDQDRARLARLADVPAADQASERELSISRDASQQPRNADDSQQPSNISPDQWEAVITELQSRMDRYATEHPHSGVNQCAMIMRVWLSVEIEKPPEQT